MWSSRLKSRYWFCLEKSHVYITVMIWTLRAVCDGWDVCRVYAATYLTFKHNLKTFLCIVAYRLLIL